MKLLIPNLIHFDTDNPNVEIVRYNPSSPIPDEAIDATGIVVWGMSQELLNDAARRLRNLVWVQLLSAGSDQTAEAGFDQAVQITNGRSLHDATVAEHTLALALASVRRIHTLVRAQINQRWATELSGIAQTNHQSLATLRGSRVAIWGYGSIGHALAPLLVALGSTVIGVARSTPSANEDIKVIHPDAIHEILPDTDLLIMILPATPATEHALDAELLALLPSHAWVINVGRGTTVDENALVSALKSRKIGGAALDVFSQEPLPTASPLWELENVILTPHAAGGRPLGAEQLIADNLAALLNGRPLKNRV